MRDDVSRRSRVRVPPGIRAKERDDAHFYDDGKFQSVFGLVEFIYRCIFVTTDVLCLMKVFFKSFVMRIFDNNINVAICIVPK